MRKNSPDAERLVNDYLRRLERVLHDLPADRRREIVDDVREHIAAARTALAHDAGEAAIRTILARLGDPADIAREAGAEPVLPARPGLLELGAVILLPVGGVLGLVLGWLLGTLIRLPGSGILVLAVVGWLLGVACLWASARWSWRDKLLGTLLLPGGLLGPILVAELPGARTRCAGLSGHEVCTSTGWSMNLVVGLPLVVVLLVLPFITAAYLDWRLRRPRAVLMAP